MMRDDIEEPFASNWEVMSFYTPLESTLDEDFRAFLSEYAAAENGTQSPFSEETLLAMQPGGRGCFFHVIRGTNETAGSAPRILGVALTAPRPEGGHTLEMAVLPEYRDQGIGTDLIQGIRYDQRRGADIPLKKLRAWSHGNYPAAARLAEKNNFVPVRELLQLRSNLTGHLPEPNWPAGVRLRTFLPGQDESALLAVNSAAFADHPEQGALTLADLQARMDEAWFDPDGLLLTVDEDDRILGFHWTKVHQHDDAAPLGEVYVVGISPEAQGRGLGKALTLAGMQHLRARGLDQATLYVDGDNPAALGLYRSLGFEPWKVDVMYALGAAAETER
ncbi:mycothiol synthase [Acaricomes phytoseiuli]|uniref:mycothiol synthase n=1 Tax=Acaricomes phytoseiuli TaxID=291968 RepID=UPI000371D299|nr:mycothiol synthase [Acaricomes phytoseiuli]